MCIDKALRWAKIWNTSFKTKTCFDFCYCYFDSTETDRQTDRQTESETEREELTQTDKHERDCSTQVCDASGDTAAQLHKLTAPGLIGDHA